MFADDTLIYVSEKNVETAVKKINNDLENLYKWLNTNRLKLNIKKTKTMIMGSTESPYIKINEQIIEIVNEMKYLGFTLDDKLKLNKQVNITIAKIAMKIGFMYRNCKFLSKYYKKLLYRSIIEPYFIYCPSLMFFCNEENLERLQIMQNKVMRFILNEKYEKPIKEMLEELDLLNVRQQLCYFMLIMVYKIVNDLAPIYLKDNLTYNSHNRNLRNADKIEIKFCAKTSTQNSLFYNGFRIFNDLPVEIRQTKELKIFKKQCMQYCKQIN